MGVSVEIITSGVRFEQRINGATGAAQSEIFDTIGAPEIPINPEFSTNTDTAVIAVHFLGSNGKALRSKQYTLTNSGSQVRVIEAGWYKGDASYIPNPFGFPWATIEVVSVTGGGLDIWTGKKNK